tara:strand:+ start:2473 stop:2676 length:204 start_codon:yes stop_codon:yes gene_type:complete
MTKKDKKGLSKREKVLMDPKLYYSDKNKETPNTLQDLAWKRALENSKPNAGTPHDWEDYERQKNKEE